MTRRKIVHIDEEKCDGCGLCVPSCAEGAIRIVDGKARLVSDVYCDGLGACLGHCPQGAISIVEREAQAFDESVVAAHAKAPQHRAAGGCPGTAARQLRLNVLSEPQGARSQGTADDAPSRLANWPVQLHLVPPTAPYLQGADVLLAADCVPFAYADFHKRFLDGRPVVIGCPKLDDGRLYVEKLARMIVESRIRSIRVVHMEVPCCLGLVRIVEAAICAAGIDVPIEEVTISIRGEVLKSEG